MNRTPLKERELPNYTRNEELLNMGTHIFGIIIGVVVLLLSIVLSFRHQDPWAVVGSIIYGVSIISLFTVSSVYHGMKTCTAKKVMRAVDHCTIYLLIAGTYTPILLAGIRPDHPLLAWLIFGLEWGVAVLAITLTAIDLKKYAKFSMICYLAMGWLIIFAIKPTIDAITWSGFWWLLSGGIAYTIGAVLYIIGKKKKYIHSLFHVFVDIACILHAVCILQYVI
jgi:hemolysin III